MKSCEHPDVAKFIHVDEAGSNAVVHIVIVVRNGVREIRELGFQPWLSPVQKPFPYVPKLPRVLH
jgi:hypothetical protein